MGRNKHQQMEIPFRDNAEHDFAAYLLRQISKLKEARRRDKNNILRLNEIVSGKFRVRPFEEDPEVAD